MSFREAAKPPLPGGGFKLMLANGFEGVAATPFAALALADPKTFAVDAASAPSTSMGLLLLLGCTAAGIGDPTMPNMPLLLLLFGWAAAAGVVGTGVGDPNVPNMPLLLLLFGWAAAGVVGTGVGDPNVPNTLISMFGYRIVAIVFVGPNPRGRRTKMHSQRLGIPSCLDNDKVIAELIGEFPAKAQFRSNVGCIKAQTHR